MSVADTVNAYLEALARHDLDAVVALYAEDATIEDPVGSPKVTGHDAIRAFYGKALPGITGARLLGQVRSVANEVAFPFEISMSFNGHDMVMDIIDIFVLNEEGRVVAMRAFWSEANMRPA